MDVNYYHIVENNIFDLKADAMVFGTSPYYKPTAGALDCEVWIRAGMLNMANATKNNKIADFGDVVATKAYDLSGSFKWLFHAVVPLCTGMSFKEEDQLGQCYINALRKADSMGLSSIVFALLGSGNMRFDTLLASDIAKEAIDRTAPSLRKMDIVLVIQQEYAEEIRKVDYFTKEYVREQVAKWRKEEEMCDDEATELFQEGEEIRLRMDKIRMDNAADRKMREIYRQVIQERNIYLQQGKSEKQFSHDMIAGIINDWCSGSNDKAELGKYRREGRSMNQLANMIGLNRGTIRKLTDPAGMTVPKRETAIALAIAMGLEKSDRLRFMLYCEPDKKYPLSFNERLLEEYLAEYNKMPSYQELNERLNRANGSTILHCNQRPKKYREKEK